jgi:hypothetical protein
MLRANLDDDIPRTKYFKHKGVRGSFKDFPHSAFPDVPLIGLCLTPRKSFDVLVSPNRRGKMESQWRRKEQVFHLHHNY